MQRATKGLKSRLEHIQIQHDVTDLCNRAARDDAQATALVPIAWRWIDAGFRHKQQLEQLLRLEAFYNGGLYDQAERLEIIGKTVPTYADFVHLLEVFDRG
jgi:hypothetical protein